MNALYLVELDAFDPNPAAIRTLGYGTGRGYNRGPADRPHFAPRVLQPARIERSMFRPGATWGRSESIFGDLVLDNSRGELDFFLRLGFDGRAIRAYRSAARRPTYPGDFSELLVGTMEQPEMRGDTVIVRIHDRRFDLQVPFQTTRYGGTGGLEGGADLGGKLKPVCLGKVYQVPAVPVDPARHIYQVNDGAVASIVASVRGKELTPGTAHATLAAFEAATPAVGTVDTYLAGGLFRLNAADVTGRVTADVVQGATAADRTAAQLFAASAQRAPSITGADLSAADLAALDARDSAVLGFWTVDDVTVAEVCSKIADTVGAGWWGDRTGLLRIRQHRAPAAADVSMTLTPNDLARPEALHRLPTNDPGNGIPVYRQVVRWGRHYTTQTGDLDASVSAARRAELGREWREAVATDEDILNRHPLSPVVVRDSLYAEEADALAEAARRMELYKLRRDRYELPIPLTADTEALDLGDTIRLDYPRYEITPEGGEGSPYVVLGLRLDAEAEELVLNVWGSSVGQQNRITHDGTLREVTTGDLLLTSAP